MITPTMTMCRLGLFSTTWHKYSKFRMVSVPDPFRNGPKMTQQYIDENHVPSGFKSQACCPPRWHPSTRILRCTKWTIEVPMLNKNKEFLWMDLYLDTAHEQIFKTILNLTSSQLPRYATVEKIKAHKLEQRCLLEMINDFCKRKDEVARVIYKNLVDSGEIIDDEPQDAIFS